jgi:phosphatidylserine/phosphatidylglycerophosphate/cardiolipin synthase-like enzyme
MLRLLKRPAGTDGLATSKLYDQSTFYEGFIRDLKRSQQEVVIESPFITTKRLNILLPTLRKLRRRGIRVILNTRNPEEYDETYWRSEAKQAIYELQVLDVQVLYTSGHHRKLAIIDREVIYEGSLNILSQNDSCEIMRRIESPGLARQLIKFVKIDAFGK